MPRFFPVRNVILEFQKTHYTQLLMEQSEFRDTCITNKLPVTSDRERNDLLAPRPHGATDAKVIIGDSAPTDFRLHVRRAALHDDRQQANRSGRDGTSKRTATRFARSK